LITQTQANQTSYYLVDGLGSTRLLTDNQGQVLNSYGYEAFGQTVSQSGAASNKYQYTGEQFDETLGNYYLRQRFYNPSNGLFSRKDTYEGRRDEPTTLNQYVYAQGNPLMYRDPSGFFSIGELGAADSIRSTLAGIQLEAGTYLINATLKKGKYGGWDFLKDFALNAAFVAFGLAAPKIIEKLKMLGKEKSVIPRGGRIIGSGIDSYGEGFGILAGRTIKTSEEGLEIVAAHLNTFGYDGPNVMMLERLRKAHAAKQPLSGADAVFYTHEIAEATLVAKGMEQPLAHASVIEKYGVDSRAIYAPDVVRAFPSEFNNSWKAFWGIN
jgi:RHS repeat-associated protein